MKTPPVTHGLIQAMMLQPANRDKLELLQAAAEYIFGNDHVQGTTGEQIVLEVIRDQAHELDALKRQLPFLMNVKAGSSADHKASLIYEDIYDQLVDVTEPHVMATNHGGTSINKNSLCHSIVDNYGALVDYWLATKDTTIFELGDSLVESPPAHDEPEFEE